MGTNPGFETRAGAVHFIKCWPEFFQDLFDGKKPFELRKNDREYKVGDKVMIHEWDPKDKSFTGRFLEWTIAYLIQDERWLQPGHCVFSPPIGPLNKAAFDLLQDIKDYLDFGPQTHILHNSELHLRTCALLSKMEGFYAG